MLNVVHIVKRFGETLASNDISFTVSPGSVVGILGPNGAGKSTLLHQISGLLYQDSGVITLDGRDVRAYGPNLYRRMACVFEDSSMAYTTLRGWENLRYQGALYGMGYRETLAKAEPMLDRLALREHMDKIVGHWSRGTMQKLALTIATLNTPEVLILDEPTLGLDVVSKRDFLQVVRGLCERGMSVILASHQSEVVEALADTVVLLSHGSVQWQGSLQDLLSSHSPDPTHPLSLETVLLNEFNDAGHSDAEQVETY